MGNGRDGIGSEDEGDGFREEGRQPASRKGRPALKVAASLALITLLALAFTGVGAAC